MRCLDRELYKACNEGETHRHRTECQGPEAKRWPWHRVTGPADQRRGYRPEYSGTDLLPGSEDTAKAATNRLPIDQALARLTLRQRQLISGLNAGLPVSQITQALDVPRTTLYDELTRIRQVFRDEGLSTYLDGPDT